jgi:transcriptional regulator with XRE-family HTH domain
MDNQRQLLQIRKRKLSILILDARTAARRTVEECAEAVGASVEEYQGYESGVNAPSLPQLELLSLYLKMPIDHFWGKEALASQAATAGPENKARSLHLRNRVIGASLRLSRTNANLSLDQLSEKTSIPEETLQKYEVGELSIPLPELELIDKALGQPIESHFDQRGPIGRLRSQQEAIQKFLDLSPEMQQFVTRPVNAPYLQLAMRMSELNVEKLRAVAESLLEITY